MMPTNVVFFQVFELLFFGTNDLYLGKWEDLIVFDGQRFDGERDWDGRMSIIDIRIPNDGLLIG